jgi:hypothetical protein
MEYSKYPSIDNFRQSSNSGDCASDCATEISCYKEREILE